MAQGRPALEVADIFRAHGPAWRDAQRDHLSLAQLKVMSAITQCRTPALGGHVLRCDGCGLEQVSYNSCRKQIILTCHGEELIKDIEVFIGHKRAGADCLTYTFLPHDGDRVIRVEPGKTRNYIASARLAFQSGRIREALGDSRRATEAICLRTWRFLAKHGLGELRVKMERHQQPIESYDLAS